MKNKLLFLGTFRGYLEYLKCKYVTGTKEERAYSLSKL
jgi:hypothetical protein